jgi:hypothetical protein
VVTVAEKPARRGAAEPRTVESTVSKMAGGEQQGHADDDEIITYSVRVKKGLRRRVRIAALEDGINAQDATAEALEFWLTNRRRRRGDANAD